MEAVGEADGEQGEGEVSGREERLFGQRRSAVLDEVGQTERVLTQLGQRHDIRIRDVVGPGAGITAATALCAAHAGAGYRACREERASPWLGIDESGVESGDELPVEPGWPGDGAHGRECSIVGIVD